MNASNQNNDTQNVPISAQPQPMEVPKAAIEPSTDTKNRQPATANDKG